MSSTATSEPCGSSCRRTNETTSSASFRRRSNHRSQRQEAALGRSLEADERAAIVGQYGHPLLTAARYRPQRHLIGPVVFPYYWIVLRVTLVLVAMGHVARRCSAARRWASAAQIGQLFENAIATALKVAAWVTALGAVADFFLARSRVLEKWNPMVASSLPQRTQRVIAGALASVPGAHHKSPPSWSRQRRPAEPSVSSLVIGLVLGVWWLAGLKFPYLFFGSGAAGLEWGPAMDRLYPVLVIAQVTMLAEQWVKYARPENTGLFRVTRFVWLIAGLALVYLVATSDHQWMVWRADSATRANATVMRFAGRNISAHRVRQSHLVNRVHRCRGVERLGLPEGSLEDDFAERL